MRGFLLYIIVCIPIISAGATRTQPPISPLNYSDSWETEYFELYRQAQIAEYQRVQKECMAQVAILNDLTNGTFLGTESQLNGIKKAIQNGSRNLATFAGRIPRSALHLSKSMFTGRINQGLYEVGLYLKNGKSQPRVVYICKLRSAPKLNHKITNQRTRSYQSVAKQKGSR